MFSKVLSHLKWMFSPVPIRPFRVFDEVEMAVNSTTHNLKKGERGIVVAIGERKAEVDFYMKDRFVVLQKDLLKHYDNKG